ncbi:MAG TPA: hypothetical protein VMT80_02310, partial [Candidatus Paceibacterota bacterium]|nr:hypothetical protein [Candidatus Paceibacterota bacterium]
MAYERVRLRLLCTRFGLEFELPFEEIAGKIKKSLTEQRKERVAESKRLALLPEPNAIISWMIMRLDEQILCDIEEEFAEIKSIDDLNKLEKFVEAYDMRFEHLRR